MFLKLSNIPGMKFRFFTLNPDDRNDTHSSNSVTAFRYYFLMDELAVESDQKHSVNTLIRNQLNSIVPVLHVDTELVLKSVNAIVKRKDLMSSHSDSRGGGLASRF